MFARYFEGEIVDVKGKSITTLIHPDFQDQFYLLVKKVHKEKAKSSVLVRLNCKKETFVKLECNIQKENGKVYYRMGFLDVTREVINEEQLIESREKFRAVADYAYHWEYWQDQQGRLLYMSPSCERITGYTKYEFFDNPKLLEDIIHPDDKHHFDEHKSIALIPGETRVEHIAEYRITRKDGGIRWIGHACQSIFKEDGTHIGQRATNRDITERKKIREKLAENLNLLSKTQEIAHIGSWELDMENDKLYWSDEIYRIFGLEPQQPKGSYEYFLKIVHPDDREAVHTTYVNSLRDDANVYEIEHRILRQDNKEVRYVYEKCYHERDNNGKVIRSVGMVQDITERKQREQKLVISDRIFNHALDMLCIAGFDGYFKTLNPSWSKVLGYTTEELMAKPWLEYVHPDDKEATKNIKASIVNGQEIYQFENRYICKDGTIKWLSWNSFPYPKENIMYGVARDITFKKQAEERLKSSELKLKEQVEEYTALNEELNQANDELRNVMEDLNESNLRTKAILSAIPDMMFVLNREGVYIDYYSPNDSLLAANPSEFLGKPASDILPQEVAEINKWALEQLFETGDYQCYSYSLQENNDTKYFDARLVKFGVDKALAIVRDITEQKKGQLTIAKNEQYLNTILQTTADGFWITDLEGNLLEVNEAYCQMSGYSLTELLNLRIAQIDVTESPEDIRKHIDSIVEEGSDIFETRHRRKDGTLFDVEVSVSYLDADGGQLICFTRDISERKYAQEKLRESEERFKLSMEATNDGLWDWDVKAKTNYYSPAYYTMLGYEVGGFSTSSSEWEGLVHPDDLDRVRVEHAKCVNGTDDSFDIEFRMKSFTGEWKWIYSRGKVVERDSKGIALRLVGTHIDVTEQKEFEQALKESETRFKALHNASFGGITIHDKGLILDCNQGLSEITGYSQEELVGMDGLLLIAEETREMVREKIRDGYEKAYEAVGIRKDGSKYPLRLEARNIPYKGKHVRVVEFRDITEQKKAQEQLAHSHYLLQYIIEHSQSAIAVHDKNMNYIYVSQRYLDEYKVVEKDIIGKNHYEIFPDLPEKWKEVHSKALKGIVSSAEDDPYHKDDGTTEWTRWECRPWYDIDGTIGGVIVYTEVITERKKVEEALKHSHKLMQYIIHYDPIATALFDRNLNYIYVSQRHIDDYKIKEKNIVGKHHYDIFPNLSQRHRDAHQRALAGETIKCEEDKFYWDDGSFDWGRWECRPWYEADGSIGGIILYSEFITQRKQAEVALQQSEERFKMLFEKAPVGYQSLTEDGHFLEVNETWLSLLGYTKEEVIGKWFGDFLAPEFVEGFRERFPLFKEQGRIHSEFKMVRKDGTQVFIAFDGRIGYTLNGEFQQTHCTLNDITEQRKAEQALRESEERFRGLYENATVGIYRTTPDGKILLANPALIKMLEYSSFEELTKRNLNNQGYETGYQRTEFMRQVEETGEVKGLESAWRTKSGKVIYISESARVVSHSSGKALYYEGIVEDITERRIAVDALRKSEERISSIFRVAPIGIGVVANRVLVEVNQTICEIIGYTKEELIGKSAQILYPTKEEFKYVGEEKYRQIAEEGTGTVETIWQRKDGSLINVLLSSTPISPDDLSQGVTFTALDITQRKQNEKLTKGRIKLLEFVDTHSLPELLKETLAVAEDLTGSQIGFYNFIDEENGVIKMNQWSERTTKEICNVPSGFDLHYPIDKAGVWADCIRKRKPLIHNNYQALPNKKGMPKGHAPLIRELAVPVFRNRRIVAVLSIGNKDTDYTQSDVDIITQLADMAWDIAERKMAEEALRGSEEQYRNLFENMTQGFALHEMVYNSKGDPLDYRFVSINPAYEKLTGLLAKDIIGKTVLEVLPKTEPEWINTYAMVAETQESVRYENYSNELGRYYSVNAFSPHKGMFATIVSDVTQRKLAEMEVKKLSYGIEQSPVMVIITDTEGLIEYVNPKFSEITGYTSDEVLGKTPRILKSGRQSEHFYKLLWDTIKSGEIWKGEMLNRKKSGETYWESALISPMKDDTGKIRNFIAIKEDITERKKAEEALIQSEIDLKEKNEEYLALNEELTESNERIAKINKELVDVTEKAVESDKLKSAFLANMSHEIRTPMNAIIGFSEMLLNPNLPTDRKDFFAQILNTACHQLLNVVEDVIDISKIETGQMEVHQSETSINKAIYRIRDIFEPQAQSNGVEINTLCFFPDNLDNIVTDASKLNQVLTNLLNNALKFTESGTVEIGYTLADNMLKFYVKDTGVGIDPSNHELIFERFRQVEMGSTRNYGGTGLGLPISKAFIEMLGGAIWVESELGKGANFFFTIPYNPVTKPEISDGKRVEPDSFCFADKIILIAEDEEANFLYMSELIEETKATLIRASDGQAAVDIIQSNPDIDLILMDIKMPVMTGVEATRIIREMDIKVPIIALTAYAMTGDRENCLAAGCNEYISKPVRRTELFKAIAKYFTNT
ncbi:MAG: PAS domain S-box protein [Tenuifilaceae bacterium]|jgi:PAS domain S-box-containing protein|nr:PAS domain S-box protein [Tenuifilaceae bacterium]